MGNIARWQFAAILIPIIIAVIGIVLGGPRVFQEWQKLFRDRRMRRLRFILYELGPQYGAPFRELQATTKIRKNALYDALTELKNAGAVESYTGPGGETCWKILP